jgi:ParB-like chromosome segregation protein Spo0J
VSPATDPDDDYTLVPATSLRLHPRNPRQGDVDAIRASIRANGWYGALVVQRSTGYILAGNHRYRAGLLEGITEYPVRWYDGDEEGALRILLADNATADAAANDDARLLHLLKQAQATSPTLAGTGYQVDDVTRLESLLQPNLYEAQRSSRDPKAKMAEEYSVTTLRQIVLVVTPDEEQALKDALDAEADRLGVTTWPQAVRAMLQEEDARD